jgi:hypothetical protein
MTKGKVRSGRRPLAPIKKGKIEESIRSAGFTPGMQKDTSPLTRE